MPQTSFVNLLIIAAVAVLAPLFLGLSLPFSAQAGSDRLRPPGASLLSRLIGCERLVSGRGAGFGFNFRLTPGG